MRRPALTNETRRVVLRCAIALGFVCAALSNCSPQPQETTGGGETHFLLPCDRDAVCGTALACMCGVCTRACSDGAECLSLASGAACVSATERPEANACSDLSAASICDVPCANDEACRALSNALHCDHGFCRNAPAEDAGTTDAATCARETVVAGEVVFLGDSFFATSHQIPSNVEALARAAGALGQDEHYRDATVLAGNALSLATPTLADRYAAARGESPVKVVIMNGGGADVLGATCETPPTQSCPVLANAAAAAQQLFAQMATDGVEQVVYVFYPDPVDEGIRAKMDVLRPLIQATCEGSAVPCVWIDLRPTFDGRYGEYILADGMNPTDAGSSATAAAIWAVLQQNCIAQ